MKRVSATQRQLDAEEQRADGLLSNGAGAVPSSPAPARFKPKRFKPKQKRLELFVPLQRHIFGDKPLKLPCPDNPKSKAYRG